MGINISIMKYLKLMKLKYLVDYKSTAMLGRQKLSLPDEELQSGAYSMFIQEDGYSETLFRYLGAEEVVSYDNSDYEHATYLHDMNLPIPMEHKNRYSFVMDGGTLEHIFNFPTAIKNAMDMLYEGGVIFMAAACNNLSSHGLYQFSIGLFTELFNGNGFVLEDICLHRFSNKLYRLGGNTCENTLLNAPYHNSVFWICARKVGQVPDRLSVQQREYSEGCWLGKTFHNDGKAKYFDIDRELKWLETGNVTEDSKIKIVLYGAGKNCKKFLREIYSRYEHDIHILGIVDSDFRKQGTLLEDIEITFSDNLIKIPGIDYIVVTPEGNIYYEIEHMLTSKYGFPLDKVLRIEELEYYFRCPVYES